MIDVFSDIEGLTAISNSNYDFTKSKIIFAVDLDHLGFEIELLKFLKNLKPDAFDKSDAIILINTPNQFHSKSFAQTLIFTLNQLGCQFVGRPIVESIKDLKNLVTPAKAHNCTLAEALLKQCIDLKNRFLNFSFEPKKNPKLLVLHSSNKATSNTLRFWQMVERHLEWDVKEIHIENNEIKDCNGCPFTTCSYFGETNSCIFKGKIIDEVFPSILECDGLILLTPNYNDSLGAQLTAFINRLSSLFRHNDFYDKTLFSVIVSGYSGSDCLAKQMISSLAINKQFRLPPKFCLSEIANEKDAILKISDIEAKAEAFAKQISENI